MLAFRQPSDRKQLGKRTSRPFLATMVNHMKKAFLLGLLASVTLILMGCANQGTTAANTNRHGLVDRGSVAPISGGPSTPGHIPQRFEP
jgi:hypothetical protein